MSHHFDTPTAREDPRLNLCDFYLFEGSSDSTVVLMTVNPEATASTAAPFRDEGLYVFRFDTNADGVEDISFKFRFGEVLHVESGGAEGHVQTLEVRVARGDAAVAGNEGEILASGTTETVIVGESGVKAYAGIVSDPFGGDSDALIGFMTEFADGSYKPEWFKNKVNYFAGRNVAGIALEVPHSVWGSDRSVHAWGTVSLYGHAPEQQVARWGLPLYTHVFLSDDELREKFNRTTPTSDISPFRESAVDIVTKLATAAGVSPKPAAYAHRVADLFGNITLPYTIGTPASFDFTGFNGRDLGDNVMDNVLTLLTNTPLGTGISPDDNYIAREFPYFVPLNATAGELLSE